MKLERYSIFEIICFATIVVISINFGDVAFYRAVGVVLLFFAIKIFKKKVGVGWQGFEPSFYLTGTNASIIGVLISFLSIMFVFFPEQTVIKFWST